MITDSNYPVGLWSRRKASASVSSLSSSQTVHPELNQAHCTMPNLLEKDELLLESIFPKTTNIKEVEGGAFRASNLDRGFSFFQTSSLFPSHHQP